MTLSPRVFREVAREYRASAATDLEGVLNAIEDLPDSLLTGSEWLSRKALSVSENVEAERFRRELAERRLVTDVEFETARNGIEESYKALHSRGISSSPERLEFRGILLTSSYWKSFVEAERKGSWVWTDDSKSASFRGELVRSIVQATNMGFAMDCDGDSLSAGFAAVRSETPPRHVDALDAMYAFSSTAAARERGGSTGSRGSSSVCDRRPHGCGAARVCRRGGRTRGKGQDDGLVIRISRRSSRNTAWRRHWDQCRYGSRCRTGRRGD